jgi:glycosyltransferase involved in cell wall biosynthesis
MHVILTVDYSPWSAYSGGAQKATHYLGMAMAHRGHKVTVIYSKPPWEDIDTPDDLPYRIEWATLFAIKSKRAAYLRPLTTLSVNKILKKIIDPNEKTVLHGNGEETGLVHRIRKKHTFAFICTPHHPHFPDVFFKHKNLPFTTKIYTVLKDAKYLMQRSAARHADFCSPPSHWAANIVREAFNIPKEKLKPIPNGVPEEFLNFKRKPEA